MARKQWQGASLWVGGAITLVVHFAAWWLLAQWQIPPGNESARIISVLIASAPAPEPAKAEKAPDAPRPRKKETPPREELAAISALSFPAERLPSLAMPPQATTQLAPMLVADDVPRPSIGVEAASFPSRMLLHYSVRSSVVDGRAYYDFRRQYDRYTISGFLEADGFFAQMFAGRFEQESEGSITVMGLEPSRFSLKRGEAQAEVASFDRVQNRVVHQRIRSEHVQPLESGAQDLQSFIFQFSPEFTRNPQLRIIRFAITNARKMDRYEFEVKGRETIPTVLGNLDTLHLVRKTDDPTDAYEAWLSPRYQYLPVRLRYLLGGRFQVEQDIASLSLEP